MIPTLSSDDPRIGGATHRVLVFTDRLQRLPRLAVALLLAAFTLPAFWAAGPALGALTLIAAFANWAVLIGLRVTGRSRGPDAAAALALGIVLSLGAMLAGLLSAAWLGVLWVIAITGVAVYSTWVEPFRLTVTHERKRIDGWKPAPPLRVLHLSDLHAEHFGPRERTLQQQIAALRPDVIVFSGDFINLSYVGDPQVEADVRRIVAGWQAPLGVYAVSGTSPEIDQPDDPERYFDGHPCGESVVGRWVTIHTPGGPLHIGGVETYHALKRDRAALAELLESRPEGGATLLLSHSPDLAPEAIDAGIDLMLSGHTHGGQLCLPGGFALLTGSHLGRRFVRGRVDAGRTTVYTTRGIGLEGLGAPRARLFCAPEITLWELSA